MRQTSDDRQYTRFSSSGYVTHDTGEPHYVRRLCYNTTVIFMSSGIL